MDATKIRLSQEEAALVMRSDWILTKNRIIQKAMHLLGSLQEAQQLHLQTKATDLSPVIIKTGAKISKGENYKGLPYLVLDQPRLFTKEHVFAIRSLFWWGHFFSSTLHLSGDHKKLYEERIIAAFSLLKKEHFFICINEDPWIHDFEAGNFIPLQNMTTDHFQHIIHEHPFCKLSKKITLDQWDDAVTELLGIFAVYMEICRA